MGFEANPYSFHDPLVIPLERIEWNRKDLGEQRKTLDDFLQDAKDGERAGLLAYGAVGSGKTWLSRVVEKEYRARVKGGAVLRTKVEQVQPDFATVYRNFIESVLHEPRFLESVPEEGGMEQEKWEEFFSDENLGTALYHIYAKDAPRDIARNWLLGSSLPVSEMREAGISLKLDSNSYRARIMRILIEKWVELFPGTLLLVDELENASPSLARALADALRDLMDSYAENFQLCSFITAQRVDEWYDYGYSEALLSRLLYRVSLDSVQPDTAPDWLREHHRLYRSSGAGVDDQLEPFTVDGITGLLKIMPPAKAYPRYIFHNCALLARDASREKKTKIDAKYVNTHKSRLDLAEVIRGY